MHRSYYDHKIRHIRDIDCGGRRVYLQACLRRVSCRQCGAVKRERLEWLADNPRYTHRFAIRIGRSCRTASIKDVATDNHLDWHTVKELDKQYMREQLARIGQPAPRAIGVDEISIGPGHRYRIIVSDLIRRRPIWFGGIDRSVESMDAFYLWLGPKKSKRIRLVVLDMCKAFRTSARKPGHATKALLIYDKFHIMRHLQEALDLVRKAEYARVSGSDRRFIKGQKYNLLRSWENLNHSGRDALRTLLAANERLNTAYVLKESFGQLWSYKRPGWAMRFFCRWLDSLEGQGLPQFEKFASMVWEHWEGIVSYCHPENKVPLGFVEGLNNKIRTIQRKAYGYRDEQYLRLKILTCMLPKH